jgi:FkbH-like protein
MTALTWLPEATDFRSRLKAALALEGSQRLEALVQLAHTRLGLVETLQLDRALSGIAPPPGLANVRLALLASATIDHLPPAIRVAGLRRRLLIDVYKTGYGQYRPELLDPRSGLRAFQPHYVLFALGARDFIGTTPLGASMQEAQQSVAAALDELRQLWGGARALNATVIQQTFLDVSEPLFGSFERQVPASPARLTAQLNDALTAAAPGASVLVLDLARQAARDGLDAWFDRARWLQGKIEIAPAAAALYGELAVRLIGAQRGLSKKCLVLDLDNTLWGGVIGDAGVEGIVLGEGSAAGEAHLALQRHAKTLAERGIILAVCSKNESRIVEAALRDHPEMLLKRADIAAFEVNWNDKAENLQRIAEQLNIGLDSLVFVDDNPVERARIREALPVVAVPELPADPADYVRCLADAGYFEAVAFTDEDRQRAGQYAANAERESLRNTLQSMDEFLQGLQMSVVFGPISALDLPRATQLINKTNQFNTTTRRFSPEEVRALAEGPQHITLQLRLLDRFGDNGLVSVMLLSPAADDPKAFELLNWVMSCRVFGRQLEDEAMNIAVEQARLRGALALRASFIPTAKNGVINTLFPALGFTPAGGAAVAGGNDTGASRWMVTLADYQHRPTHISRRSPA